MKISQLQTSTLLRVLLLSLTLLFANTSRGSEIEDLAALANKGDSYAQFNLGAAFATGNGVTKDFKQAFVWFTKSAELGNARAQEALGRFYEEGKGTQQNHQQAIFWYTKSADQGYAQAQFNLGLMFVMGIGTKKNETLALNLFIKAANQGFIQAQGNLGYMYSHGLGVSLDFKQAYVWDWIAVKSGAENIATNLALDEHNLSPQLLAEAKKEAKLLYEKIEKNKVE